MYMLMMVLDDTAHLNDVLNAWESAGVGGVTIIESTGLHRVLRRHSADMAFVGFSQMFGSARVGHNTLFTVIDDLELAEAAVSATEAVLGDLTEPDKGIIFALPVAKTWGLTLVK
ncbi:hypothetical protein [Candidatus Leptofilum sp.]|uniref:hypothetical protein n=1 Tax=Candidatus Leptofilum sp. TaxID=3241576 RepID=UPI003B59FCE6